MFSTAARKRMIVATVFVFCSVVVALRFTVESKADTAPLVLGPVMTATDVDSLFTRALSTKVGSKIAPEVLTDIADGARASVVVYLADQADVSSAYGMKDQDARGWYVYNTLTRHAERTQADIKSFLTERGCRFQSFWAANMLVVDVDRTLAEQLAARSDVARVDSNRPGRWIEDPAISDRQDTTARPAAIEWGVNNVNAPAVWAMGFTGQGIVVGDLDTGTRWTHIVLKPKYRGWNGSLADHNYNWHDSIHTGGGVCGANTLEPCDDDGHGTHTAGSMVGDDGAGNQVGVAPGARWIGCRNMDQGNGTPATYTECFQFTIAPTDLSGNNPDPTLRPHVLNNSWTCPASEGCTTGAELETIVNNTQAAGIFVEASAGNAGPGCSSVSDPPSIYSSSFSTGAIDISNNLAGFSSRGPSLFYDPSVLKPNVSAPGVNVRSGYGESDTLFVNLSGTSMAGPHVCGVVALLWSARPQLARDIAATKAILQNTANPGVNASGQTCGGTPSTQIPNNSFGYGRVDALAAVNSVGGASPTPTSTPTTTATSTPTATPTVFPSPVPEFDLSISQADAPDPVNSGQHLTYTLVVTNAASALGGSACPTVRFDYPTGVPIVLDSTSGSGGFAAAADAAGVTFTGGCLSSLGGMSQSATLTVVVIPQSPGTLTSAGSNVVVDPENTYNESTETNNTAQTVQTTVTVTHARSDFDGDGRSDISVFRPAEGNWYLDRSTQGFTGVNFGLSDDILTPGDFDGDGKTDIAVFRPSNGFWYRINSHDGTSFAFNFGTAGDIPQPSDFDGDGKDDLAVFRPSTGTWYWQRSSDGQFGGIQFGLSGDVPLAGDYDSDGQADISVFRSGMWYRLTLSNGRLFAVSFGLATDLPVPADYDGDGRKDIAVFRPSEGIWYRIDSGTGNFGGINWGQSGDVPVPADYDGDGRDDVAVFRDGFWYINRSTAGPLAFPFGLSVDIPVSKIYAP